MIFSCQSQDKKESNKTLITPKPVKHTIMNTENNYRNLVNGRIEYFDIKKFYQNNQEGIGKTYEDEKGSLVEESAGDNGSWFMSNTTMKNSLFTVHKEFNSKGVIIKKGVTFKNYGGALGMWYEFDDSGKLVKENDTDKDYRITFDDIVLYCKENNINLNDQNTNLNRGINDETKKVAWGIEYRGEYNGKFGASIIIELDGTNGEIQKVTCINGKHNDSTEILYDIKDEKKKSAQIYKTYQGKDYTESEWKIFEQEQYNEHLRKTGRADMIRPTETPKTENKKSFLADEDDVKPKKKGFWG